MATDLAHEFANYLRDHNHLSGDGSVPDGAARSPNRPLQNLWELTELSASDFADEVAAFFEAMLALVLMDQALLQRAQPQSCSAATCRLGSPLSRISKPSLTSASATM